MAKEKKLFLLDAYALIFRSYYAFIRNPMFNNEGLNTSCIFGFINTLEELLSKEKPTHIAVAFDPPGPNFRHEMFPQYKANRDATPEDIIRSIPYIKDILKAYGIPILQIDGYEADDVIGTMALKAKADGYTVYMMTSDKDYIQLLTENIYMYKPSRTGVGVEIVDSDKAGKDFQLTSPKQFIDILALMGDASDNIPGAPGVGEKTAIKLIAEFESVEKLLENTHSLKGKIQEIIVNNKDKIEISKKLATIETNIPMEVSEEELILSQPDLETIKTIFSVLNFKTLEKRVISRFSSAAPTTNAQTHVQHTLFDLPEAINHKPEEKKHDTINTISHKYYLADDDQKRQDLVKQLLQQKEICFDTETTTLEVVQQAQIVGLSFAWKKGEAYYVPLPVNQTESQIIADQFKPVLENEQIVKIGQNIKFDILVLKNYGIEVKGKIFDTMLAHYLLQPEQQRHNMDYMSEQYLNYSPVPIEDLIGQKGRHLQTMRSVPIEKIKEYAAE